MFQAGLWAGSPFSRLDCHSQWWALRLAGAATPLGVSLWPQPLQTPREPPRHFWWISAPNQTNARGQSPFGSHGPWVPVASLPPFKGHESWGPQRPWAGCLAVSEAGCKRHCELGECDAGDRDKHKEDQGQANDDQSGHEVCIPTTQRVCPSGREGALCASCSRMGHPHPKGPSPGQRLILQRRLQGPWVP